MQFGSRIQRREGGVLVAATLAIAACTSPPKQLPPRTPPPREAPAVPLPPTAPDAGFGRVVLHGTDGPMTITAQADHTFVPPGGGIAPTRTGELCGSTPCVVDLPAGRYRLFLSSADGSFAHGDTDDLVVTEGITYYSRAPGHYEPPTWFPVVPTILVVGAAALVTGGAVLATDQEEPGGTRTAGYVLLGAGAALGIWGGIEMYDASRAKQQEGATTIWHR